MTRASRIALGEIGFERAAVWSAVGFALSYAAFDAVTLVVPSGGSATGTVAMVSALVALTAVGVIAFVATGGGVLPATLLSYGPFAAVLLRTVGPNRMRSPSPIPPRSCSLLPNRSVSPSRERSRSDSRATLSDASCSVSSETTGPNERRLIRRRDRRQQPTLLAPTTEPFYTPSVALSG